MSRSGVAITDKHGKHIVVRKGGIHGIDSFVDSGPITTDSVTNAMKSLKGLKSLKSMKQSLKGFPYDNVEEMVKRARSLHPQKLLVRSARVTI